MSDTLKTISPSPELKKLKPLIYRKRLWLTLLLLVMSVAHPLWLAWISTVLVYNKPGTAPVIIIPLSGRTSLQSAKSMLEANPLLKCHIILEPLNRVHRLGIIKPPIEQATIELKELGINPGTIQFHVPQDDATLTENRYEQIVNQLEIIIQDGEPHTSIQFIAPSYMTRRIAWQLSRHFDGDIFDRISIKGVPPQDFELPQWWKSRHGIRCVVGEYMLLANLLISKKHGGKPLCTEADFKEAAINSKNDD